MFDDKLIANIQINYYYGSLIKLNEFWNGYDIKSIYNKLYYIIDGECEFVIDGVKYSAKAGDIALIPAGVKHSFYHINDKYIKKYWLHFDFNVSGNNFFETLDFKYIIEIGINKTAVSIMKNILKYANDSTLCGNLNLKASIMSIVSFYLDKAEVKMHKLMKNDINFLLQYINENLNSNTSVDRLAEMMHMHPNYFIKYFKEQTGYSPMKYIASKKIEYAKSMLENSNIPIAKIMETIAFTDACHFSKTFKKFNGCSPKQFRQRYGNKLK